MIRMKTFYFCTIIVGFLGSVAESYSKYGRTCKDIGCLSSEQCVMETDPCSYYKREGECGSYPTCKRVSSNNAQPTCQNYVCPPTKVCKLDNNTPKCVDDHSKSGHVGYNLNAETPQQNNPSAPEQPSGGGGALYPNLPARGGETTPRPNVYRPQPAHGGGGYQGGQIGSGYPGQQRPSGYPQQPGGYPQQPGGYPQQQPGGYPGGYPAQQGGGGGYYPPYSNNQRYPSGGNNYPGGGYNNYPYGGGNQPSRSGSGGIVDKITDSLKSYGTDLLKNALGKIKFN